jgi:hypothetical protein
MVAVYFDQWVIGLVDKLLRTAEPEECHGNRESDLPKPILPGCGHRTGLRWDEDRFSEAITKSRDP